jgi:hypothetical protein
MITTNEQYISKGTKFSIGDKIICEYKILAGNTPEEAHYKIEQKRGTIIQIEKSIFNPECHDMAGATIKWDSEEEHGFQWLSELKK